MTRSIEEISEQELNVLLGAKKEFTLLVPEAVAKFAKNIPEVDFSKPTRVRPTAVLGSREIAEILLALPDNPEGRHILLTITAGSTGGSVLYKSHEGGGYEARVVWN